MTRKKTCWYTCIAPLRGGPDCQMFGAALLGAFIPLGFKIGAAFQIQDDILNLPRITSMARKSPATSPRASEHCR